MTVASGARVELIPVFMPRFVDGVAVPKLAGYRLNVVHVGEGLASPDELDEIAAMLTRAAEGARDAAG